VARVKGFAAWRPQKKTEALLWDIDTVLSEYRRHLPLTIRQVFYRLVGKGHPKTETFYAAVQEACNRARRSGRIAFAAIRDDGVSQLGGESFTFDGPDDYYRTYEEIDNYYKRSWHEDQPARVQVLCEAAGMVPMISRAVGAYRVSVASSSGFDSLTVKHDLYADAVRHHQAHGKGTILLHLGDHDPSGVSIHESMQEDLEAFCADRGHAGLIELRRVALVPTQIRSFGIATQPDAVKPSDSRSKAFIERGLEPAAQLEAIPPDTLIAVVRQAVETVLDMDALAASQLIERAERAEVQAKLDEVNEVLRVAFGLEDE
jgi:hypothetical protein